MEDNNYKLKKGVIKSYNNFNGTILTSDKEEYLFVKKDVEMPNIEIGMKVQFRNFDCPFENEIIKIAKYVREDA